MSAYPVARQPSPPQVATGVAPPHSIEAEEAVLGAILMSERVLDPLVIEEGLRPDDFYRERHRLVYDAMLGLYNDSQRVDVLTVADRLEGTGKLEEAGGKAAIDGFTGGVPGVGGARRYAQIVREHALMRRLLTTTYEIQASVLNHQAPPRELVERAERAVLEVARDDRQQDFSPIADILHVELERMHKLSQEGTALTGTPSGFKDLDEITGGFQPGNLVIIAARPSMGKCLSSGALVQDPMSGARRPIEDVVGACERGEDVWVTAVGPDLRLLPAKVSAGMRSGVQPLLRVTTRLGRRVEATAHHPLLTLDGYKRIDELEPGSRIAVPRTLPQRGAPKAMPDHELVLLAALIADGCVLESPPRFTAAAESPVLTEVLTATGVIGARASIRCCGTNRQVGLSGITRAGGNPVTALCRAHGVMGKRSEDKFVPDAIFGLDEQRIARFLGVLYACDGHVHATDRLRQIGYTTISERLARDVQHLLLRLGIVSRIRTLRRPVYDGTDKVAREVLITGQAGIGAFCALIDVCDKRVAQDRAVAGLAGVGPGTNVDTVPPGVWPRVLAAKGARPWRELSVAAGHPANHNWHVGTRGVSRGRLAKLAEHCGDEGLDHLATSELWWDEIVSIEPIAARETYDLEVPLHHNFVADDVVVHNSALVANIAENVAVDHGKAVALFSLEMSESELAQRFVASQARIKGDELRKGRVAEHRWPKIVTAADKLSRAPLFIDDSSDVGILEIRAKARRLHQQHDGGLGLVIIDYLQLMRPDGRTDSRVLQIGEMSRGLKILARELAVPVIALSQLSRAVETRGQSVESKRPLLSDLRESGSIEQDADLVMFIFREEYYDHETEREGIADLIISKHRNGALGDVELTFAKEYPKFLNYAGDRFSR